MIRCNWQVIFPHSSIKKRNFWKKLRNTRITLMWLKKKWLVNMKKYLNCKTLCARLKCKLKKGYLQNNAKWCNYKTHINKYNINYTPNQQSATQTTNSSNLQEELSTSLETINLLREQNGGLKSMISNLQMEIDQTAHPNNEPATQIDSNQQVPPPGELASLNQVMAERDFLTTQIEEHKQERHKLLDKLHALQNEKKNLSSPESDPGYQDLSHNMSLLQDRFATVMRAKVEAESRVEDLEHINLQLQNECDTIGEYITLYHNQRQLLKQRHNEKDEYVSSMAQEREAMQQKLEKLQSLVLSLLSARESAKNLTSTPHRRKLDPKIDDSVLDGLSSSTSYPADWPDMLEDEEARQPTRPDILPENASLPSHGKNRLTLDGEKSLPGKLERLDLGTEREDATATQIISLLEQMQKPTFPTPDEAPRGFCLRYSGRYTAV
uniref:Golgin subfamily A conserved domain-containing protein n=1 Tax=Ciona savignyi TaxID=51511 RepID=H2YAR6_CIOSA